MIKSNNKKKPEYDILYRHYLLTSCPRQLARQNAVSIDQILTRRSSDPVITYLPERSNIATEHKEMS